MPDAPGLQERDGPAADAGDVEIREPLLKHAQVIVPRHDYLETLRRLALFHDKPLYLPGNVIDLAVQIVALDYREPFDLRACGLRHVAEERVLHGCEGAVVAVLEIDGLALSALEKPVERTGFPEEPAPVGVGRDREIYALEALHEFRHEGRHRGRQVVETVYEQDCPVAPRLYFVGVFGDDREGVAHIEKAPLLKPLSQAFIDFQEDLGYGVFLAESEFQIAHVLLQDIDGLAEVANGAGRGHVPFQLLNDRRQLHPADALRDLPQLAGKKRGQLPRERPDRHEPVGKERIAPPEQLLADGLREGSGGTEKKVRKGV